MPRYRNLGPLSRADRYFAWIEAGSQRLPAPGCTAPLGLEIYTGFIPAADRFNQSLTNQDFIPPTPYPRGPCGPGPEPRAVPGHSVLSGVFTSQCRAACCFVGSIPGWQSVSRIRGLTAIPLFVDQPVAGHHSQLWGVDLLSQGLHLMPSSISRSTS